MDAVEVDADAQLDDDTVMVTLTGTAWLLNVHASPSQMDASPRRSHR
jgi:hypothetical protein